MRYNLDHNPPITSRPSKRPQLKKEIEARSLLDVQRLLDLVELRLGLALCMLVTGGSRVATLGAHTLASHGFVALHLFVLMCQ